MNWWWILFCHPQSLKVPEKADQMTVTATTFVSNEAFQTVYTAMISCSLSPISGSQVIHLSLAQISGV